MTQKKQNEGFGMAKSWLKSDDETVKKKLFFTALDLKKHFYFKSHFKILYCSLLIYFYSELCFKRSKNVLRERLLRGPPPSKSIKQNNSLCSKLVPLPALEHSGAAGCFHLAREGLEALPKLVTQHMLTSNNQKSIIKKTLKRYFTQAQQKQCLCRV